MTHREDIYGEKEDGTKNGKGNSDDLSAIN